MEKSLAKNSDRGEKMTNIRYVHILAVDLHCTDEETTMDAFKVLFLHAVSRHARQKGIFILIARKSGS